MKNKRIFTRIIMPLLLLNILTTNLFSQTSFSVGSQDIDSFILHLDCEYGDQIYISPTLIESFLQNLLSENEAIDCFSPAVSLTSLTADAATFKWPPTADAQGYIAASLGLRNGQSETQLLNYTGTIFDNLQPQLFLFVFITECLLGNSIAEVFIVDMDIFVESLEFYSLDCLCSKGTPLLSDSSCPYYDTYFFPWSNTCFANKYQFRVSNLANEGSYSEEFYVIAEDMESATPTIYVLSNCNPNNSTGLGNYAYGDSPYFQVMISSNGIHFYLLDENTTDLEVFGNLCDCFNQSVSKSSPPPRHRLSQNQKLFEGIQLSPNPFHEEVKLSFSSLPASPVTIMIFDLHGKMLKRMERNQIGKGQSLLLPTHDLLPGLYQIYITIGNQHWQQRIVKTE